MKSHNSDPEGECDLDDPLDVPASFINENEKNFLFVFKFVNINELCLYRQKEI